MNVLFKVLPQNDLTRSRSRSKSRSGLYLICQGQVITPIVITPISIEETVVGRPLLGRFTTFHVSTTGGYWFSLRFSEAPKALEITL